MWESNTIGKRLGQRLNLLKTSALQLDSATAPPTLGTLTVSDHTTPVLGVALSSITTAQWETWTGRLAPLLLKTRQARLSIFGIVSTASAYGLAKFLHHLDHHPLPALGCQALLNSVRDAVNGFVPAPGQRPGFFKFKLEILIGNPKDGGFGLLPLAQHAQSRLIKRSCSVITAPLTGPTWISIVRSELFPAQMPPQVAGLMPTLSIRLILPRITL